MSLMLPKGVQFGFADVDETLDLAVDSLTNAVQAVFDLADGETAPALGTVMLTRTSGWPLANNKVAVVGAGSTLRGLDTSDVQLFPAAGFGTVALIASGTFTDFTQQGEPSTSGGEQQFWQGIMLEDPLGRQISLPTFKNAKTLTIPLYFDPSQPWYAKAKAADAKGRPLILRAKMPNRDVLYWYGYLSFDADPSITANTPMGNTATFTIIGESTLVRAA